jgi:cystathionine beta-lyase
VVAATKYLGGHADVMLGIVICNEKEWPNFSAIGSAFGMTASADDASLVLRGIRTLDVRMQAHQKSALTFCEWLQHRDEVETIFYPALESHPNHDIWKRDFHAANGLVTIEMKQDISMSQTIRFIDGLQLFGIGASWGGYESLAVIMDPQSSRETVDWSGKGPFVRFHIGLEDIDDLISDTDAAFSKM